MSKKKNKNNKENEQTLIIFINIEKHFNDFERCDPDLCFADLRYSSKASDWKCLLYKRTTIHFISYK